MDNEFQCQVRFGIKAAASLGQIISAAGHANCDDQFIDDDHIMSGMPHFGAGSIFMEDLP
jgi:hypothetical protein